MKQQLTKFKLLLVCMLMIQVVFAQTGTIRGKITDGKSREGLMGANVGVKDGTGSVTDIDGAYSLDLPAGKHLIEITYVGYETKTKNLTIIAGKSEILDMELEETVLLLEQSTVTASKFEKPLGEVTVSLDIVRPKLAENVNATQVGDVVQKVPGVSIIDGQANIRGGSGYSYGAGSRVLLLLNDMPILDGAAGLPNWRDLPIENLESIEVVKGAASALYGSSALNGIINIRTAEARSKPVLKFAMFGTLFDRPTTLDSAGVKITANSAHYDVVMPKEMGMSMAFRQRFKRFDVVMSSMYFFSDDYNLYDRKIRFNGDFRYRFTDKVFAGVRINFNKGASRSFLLQKDAFQNAFIPSPGTDTESKTLRFAIDPYFTAFDDSGNKHKIMARWLRTGNDNSNNQGNFADVIYGEYQFARTFEKLGDLNFVTGVVGNFTKGGGALYGVTNYNGRQYGIDHETFNLAGYIQLDKKFFDKLNISAGVRYESFWSRSSDRYVYTFERDFSILDPNINPYTIPLDTINPDANYNESRPVFRIGANYQPFKYTYIRASWGQGYRFPTIAERFVVTTLPITLSGATLAMNIAPNPSLKSETGWSAEFAVKQGVQITKSWQGYIDVSAFWTQYQNMMEFTFGGADPNNPILGFQSVNIGDTDIKGIEASIMGQGTIGKMKFNTIMGYTFIDPTFQKWSGRQDSLSSADYNVLKYRFRHTFKFDAEVFYKGFSIGGSVQYNSYMEAIDDAFNNYLSGVREYRRLFDGQGASLVDFRAGYQINKHVKISFVLKNALNALVYLRPALPESPRTFSIRLDYDVFGDN
jgi:outer membrane receptor protein involved in Fe transport